MEKKYIGKNWYLGETLHAGIGQGYWQTSPLQLCLMMAQIANGGYKIKPRIILTLMKKNKFDDLNKFISDKKLFSDDVVSFSTNLLLNLNTKVYLGILKI